MNNTALRAEAQSADNTHMVFANEEHEKFWCQFKNGLVSIHKKVVDEVRVLTSQACINHRAYYPLDEEGMEYLAGIFGLKKEQMIKKLVKYDLFHVTTSMKGGHKANVNCGAHSARRYCIKRNIGYGIEKDGETETTYDF